MFRVVYYLPMKYTHYYELECDISMYIQFQSIRRMDCRLVIPRHFSTGSNASQNNETRRLNPKDRGLFDVNCRAIP